MRISASLFLLLAVPFSAVGQEASVTLPLAEYDRLVATAEAADRQRRDAEEPVADLVEQRTEIVVVREEAELVTYFRVELRGTPTRPVVLPLVGLVEEARVEGTPAGAPPASLHRKGGEVVLVAPAPGSYEVTVRSREPFRNGWMQLPLVASPAPVRRVVVDLPEGLEWTCDDVTVISETPADDGRRRLELAPRRDTEHVLWAGESGGSAKRPDEILARLSAVTVVEVDAHRLQRQDVILYDVLRGALERFDVVLPPDLEVDQAATDEGEATAWVDGGTLRVEREWKLEDDVGHLLVRFAPRGVAETAALVPLRPDPAPRERYLVTAATVAALLVPRPADAWRRVDLEDLPTELDDLLDAIEPTGVWRLAEEDGVSPESGPAAAPSLGVKILDGVANVGAVVRSRETMTLWTPDGSLVHRDRFSIHGEASSLAVVLPAGATLWSTVVDGTAVRPLERDGAVVVPLAFAGPGRTTVELVAVEQQAIERGRSRVRLSLPRVAEPVLHHSWRLLLPRENRYRFAGGDLRPVPDDETAFAAGTGIVGVVSDSDGMVLPGVTLTLSPGNRMRISDVRGRYAFGDLAPGRYQLHVTLAGFSSVEYPEIGVYSGRSTRVDVELSVAAVEETITVTSESPYLDVEEVELQWQKGGEQEMQQSFDDALGELERGLTTGVKPLTVEIPETGKVLVLSGALPPAEVSVELEVRRR